MKKSVAVLGLGKFEAVSQGHLPKVEQKYWQLIKMRIL